MNSRLYAVVPLAFIALLAVNGIIHNQLFLPIQTPKIRNVVLFQEANFSNTSTISTTINTTVSTTTLSTTSIANTTTIPQEANSTQTNSTNQENMTNQTNSTVLANETDSNFTASNSTSSSNYTNNTNVTNSTAPSNPITNNTEINSTQTNSSSENVSSSTSTSSSSTSSQTSTITSTIPPEPKVCTIVTTGLLNFGHLSPGTTSLALTPLTATDTGNAAGVILINGTDWSGNAGSVGWTSYSPGGTFVGEGTKLTLIPNSTDVTIQAGSSLQFSFELSLPSRAIGKTILQTITMSAEC